jgi:hypothetical protein
MSDLQLAKQANDIIQVRKELEKSIKKEVFYNLRLAKAKSRNDRKVGIKRPKVFNLDDIVSEVRSRNTSDEISEGRIRAKVFNETVFRSASKYKASPDKLNMLVVINNLKDGQIYFEQLTQIGSKLGFPDLTEDIKERIIFGVQDLTAKDAKGSNTTKGIWARIITQSQYAQMKLKNPTMIIIQA